jgi:hypothetical protein
MIDRKVKKKINNNLLLNFNDEWHLTQPPGNPKMEGWGAPFGDDPL